MNTLRNSEKLKVAALIKISDCKNFWSDPGTTLHLFANDQSMAHRYWSCRCIRPLIREAFICRAGSSGEGWLMTPWPSWRLPRRALRKRCDVNPEKSMMAIAKKMDVGSMTIVKTIHEDLGLQSYFLLKSLFLTENMKDNRKGKAATLLNNLKDYYCSRLRLFSNEKNSDVD
ncbi:hypothetical protein LAZ67_1001540 [Cordylochernes scorpioides]|uniref:Uncharacterized protein n=1 Tax=Cordylochernes scorpioides TaxID=51811 RepID=A0ABY6JWI6_9ARAC|nr:hypothetical protein LAZ67_1001540 [Cordylochernes scorpioides]